MDEVEKQKRGLWQINQPGKISFKHSERWANIEVIAITKMI